MLPFSAALYRTFRPTAYARFLEWCCESRIVDLSFSRFEADGPAITMPTDLAVLMVGIAARQAMSPTARINATRNTQASLQDLLSPSHGAFNQATAEMMDHWREE